MSTAYQPYLKGRGISTCLVLPKVVIGRGVRLHKAVVDKHCVLPDGLEAGINPESDHRHFHVTPRGVILITPEMLGHYGSTGTKVDHVRAG
jgi:glucose-1-phosphate adenylyltransferase